MKNKIEVIINSIKQITNQTSRKTFIIGVSGGIDSCLSLKILTKYFSDYKIYAYYLPIEFDYEETNIELIEQNFNINIQKVDLTNIWKDTINSFQINDKFNSYNIKSKIRSMFLFSQAFEKDGLVISNINYDEYYLGYFTKFGDSNGDVFPLLNLTKQDIIEVAKYLELPNEIINKLPSADLYINQNDENEFGFSYKDLDEYLNFKKIDPNIENKIIKRVEKNKHKRILEHLINNDFRKE